MNSPDNKRFLAALNDNWQAEMEGFSTYSTLAKNESDPHRRNALRGLATAEQSPNTMEIRKGKQHRWRAV
jgi:hypothetical protein